MYVKLIDGIIQEAPKNKDNIINYNLDIEQMILDGYKLFVPCEVPETNRMHHTEYTQTKTKITENLIWDETIEQYNERIEREQQIERNQEIDEKIKQLEQFAVKEILNDNKCNIEIIKNIISGLNNAKYQNV